MPPSLQGCPCFFAILIWVFVTFGYFSARLVNLIWADWILQDVVKVDVELCDLLL